MKYLVRIHDDVAYTYYVERIVEVDDITEIPLALQKDDAFMENLQMTFTNPKDFQDIWEHHPRLIFELEEYTN